MTKKTAEEADSYVVERHAAPFGRIKFPAVASVTNLILQRIEAGEAKRPFLIDTEDKKHSNYDKLRVSAFQAGEFIREQHPGSEWDIYDLVENEEGEMEKVPLSVNDFMAWEHKPDKEIVNFVMWIRSAFAMYKRDVFDPNFKPGS